ncbi:hypothetical protein DXB59_02550 [Ruminococcus sp. OM05-10BH]|nr:hypothetical protein DXB59_02550 [Ruminococcus sp. OM05-10BH]
MSENQKLMGYTKSKGIQYFILHIKKYNLLMKTFISPNLKIYEKSAITIDFIWSVIRYGVGINDYFQYNFYRRKSIDRKSFIVARNRKYIIRTCNGAVKQADFDDKCRFNKIFNDFLGRKWLDLDKSSEEEFEKFVKENATFMTKIKDGSGGNGIEVISTNEKNLSKLYKECKRKHVIVEELIHQHKEMGKFNPESVNTLRVITLVTSKEVKVMDAVFRCGNGEKCTDNFHHFGLAAIIDPETGIVVTPAVDKLNQKFYIHPRTKEQIIGFKIPYWEQIVDTVKKAAMVRKNIKFIGWDIAIKEDGNICIIEGNCAADPDITQMPDQIGKWEKYYNALGKIQN